VENRESRFDKDTVLKALSENVKKADSLPLGPQRDTFEKLILRYTSLAEEMGATNFEIADANFSATDEKDRQELFDTYCQQLWTASDDFGSLEELKGWADDMIKIRDKYNLVDTLKIVKEYARSETEKNDLEKGLSHDISSN
jgi:hypothetical protein